MPNYEVVMRLKAPRIEKMIVGAESDGAALQAALDAFGPDYEFVSIEPVPGKTVEEVLAERGDQ